MPMLCLCLCILLTKITAAQNEVVISYQRVWGQYFLAVVFAVTIMCSTKSLGRCFIVSVTVKLVYSTNATTHKMHKNARQD